jgi:hypothetical protein
LKRRRPLLFLLVSMYGCYTSAALGRGLRAEEEENMGRLVPTRGIPTTAQLLLGTFLAAACSPPTPPSSPGPSAESKSVAPPFVVPKTSINAVMVALVDHAAHNLWNVEREGMAPKSDADWELIAEHAIQLVAAGPAITAGGIGPTDATWVQNPAWRAHAQKMSDAALAAFQATQAKSFERLIKANSDLVDSCEGCHKEFKPAMPTEGIVHGHAHQTEPVAGKKPSG